MTDERKVYLHYGVRGPGGRMPKRTLCGRKARKNPPLDAPACPTCIDRASRSYHAITYTPKSPLVFSLAEGTATFEIDKMTVIRLREEKL